MDKKKLLCDLLRRIEQGEEPRHEALEVDYENFGTIVEMATDEGFLKGASVVRAGQGNKVKMVFLKGSKVTLSGLNFIEENCR